MGSYPHLNFRWDELKRKTTDSHFNSLVASGSNIPQEITSDLFKMEKTGANGAYTPNILPDNKLKYGMFLRNWNLYVLRPKSTEDLEKSEGGMKRQVIYLTKDELKKGDKIKGDRLSDHEIYPEVFKSLKRGALQGQREWEHEHPMIIMVAKYDNLDKIKNVEETVDEICIELGDSHMKAVPHFDIHQDYLSIMIKPEDKYKLIFSDELLFQLTEVSERIIDYLKIEKYKGFKYKIEYKVKGPFYYYGNEGRFKELIEKAEKYDRDYRGESPIYKRYASKELPGSGKRVGNIDVNRLTSGNLKLFTDDIKILNQHDSGLASTPRSRDHLYNCSTQRMRDTWDGVQPTFDIKEVEFEWIKIVFTK